MSRIKQLIGTKGSLKWIQLLVNERAEVLNHKIQQQIKGGVSSIEWLSPKSDDEFAEYRDEDFLKVLGVERSIPKLKEFWPTRGPQWDALGRFNDDGCFIVEAKANIPEIFSNLQAKSKDSITMIKKSLMETQEYLNCKQTLNWTSGFYQYANRIAHLYFLRCICNVQAFLVFIYFINDHTHIATTRQNWDGALTLQKSLMGLKHHKLQKYVIDVFIDVKDIDI